MRPMLVAIIEVHFTKSWVVTEMVFVSFLNTFAPPSNSEDVTIMVALATAEGKLMGFRSGFYSALFAGHMPIQMSKIGITMKVINEHRFRRSTVFTRHKSV